MVDKVKPLKIESAALGSQSDMYPTETNPAEDYITAKGFTFEALDTHLIEKVENIIKFKIPNFTVEYTYSSNRVSQVLYKTNSGTYTFLVLNVTYSGIFASSEVYQIKDAGGSTVRTITINYSYSGSNISASSYSEV